VTTRRSYQIVVGIRQESQTVSSRCKALERRVRVREWLPRWETHRKLEKFVLQAHGPEPGSRTSRCLDEYVSIRPVFFCFDDRLDVFVGRTKVVRGDAKESGNPCERLGNSGVPID
jgi:hypothetical protein